MPELTGEKTCSGGSTHRAGSIELRQDDPLPRQPVNVRRGDGGVAGVAQVAVAQVIHQEYQDVGWWWRGCWGH